MSNHIGNLKKFVRRGLNVISARTVILLYHRVASLDRDPWGLAVQPDYFAEQLEVLRGIGVVRLNEAGPSAVSPLARGCSVAITFDDGYSDNYTQALPLLEKFEIPATFFVTTGYIGKPIPFWWDELQSIMLDAKISGKIRLQVGEKSIPLTPDTEERRIEVLRHIHPLIQHLDVPERQEAIESLRQATGSVQIAPPGSFAMTEEQLCKMGASPFAEIGAHTVTHPKLAALSPKRQFEEIEDSRNHLENLIGKEVTSFSYPYGASIDFTKKTEHLVIASGFQRACTTEAVVFRGRHNGFSIPRLTVPNANGELFSRWLWSYLQ